MLESPRGPQMPKTAFVDAYDVWVAMSGRKSARTMRFRGSGVLLLQLAKIEAILRWLTIRLMPGWDPFPMYYGRDRFR